MDDVESGRFTIGSASLHHGINGSMTVRRWLRTLGKNHLLPEVVCVETIDEGDLILKLCGSCPADGAGFRRHLWQPRAKAAVVA